jgi:hypothetical protein
MASASFPLFTQSLVQVLLDNEENMSSCPIMHESRVDVDEEAYVPRVQVNHSPKDDGTLHLLVC